MAYPNTPPPEDPDDRAGQRHGQDGTGGTPPPPGQSGGYQEGGYQQGGPEPSSATTGQPNANERQMGLLSHLGGGLAGFFFSGFGWVVPLVLYLVKKDESPFIRDQSLQALNFQLVITVGIVVSWVLTFIIIGLFTWLAFAVLSLVFGILGGMAANGGEWYRYPFNVNWVK